MSDFARIHAILDATTYGRGVRRDYIVARNLAPELLAVAEDASREHYWVETVNQDGDDWLGCLCGESGGCATLHALDALHAKMKETL